ncbi:Uncharacterised protein [Candidatus Gugararchaeum adminiculabundum]|nr:Uncharacterised protein [Candidatus Gugararchaeum adminiculabundum]
MKMNNAGMVALALVALFCALSFGQWSGSMPPLKGSLMKINVVDADTGAFVPANLTIAIGYSQAGKANENYVIALMEANQEVTLTMPPEGEVATAKIKVSAEGYETNNDEVTITSQEYWGKVGNKKTDYTVNWGAEVTVIAGDQGEVPPTDETEVTSYVAQHTFALKKKPVPVVPADKKNDSNNGQANGTGENTAPSASSSPCKLPIAIFALVLGAAVFARRRN